MVILIPSSGGGRRIFEIEVTEAFQERASRMQATYAMSVSRDQDVESIAYKGGPECRVIEAEIEDVDDHYTLWMEDSVLELPEPLEGAEDQKAQPVYLHATRTGILCEAWVDSGDGHVEAVIHLTWKQLGVVEEDLLRCRDGECAEEHPVATLGEMVSCRGCQQRLFNEWKGEAK